MSWNYLKNNKINLYTVLLIITYTLTFMVTVPDRDLWARLAAGSLFFQTGDILRHDIFAYTPVKDLWIDHEWGSGVIFYFLTSHFGDAGLFILKFILILLTFLLILKTIKISSSKNINISPALFILMAFSIAPIVVNTVRSQIFTFIFFVLWLYVLERVRLGENRLLWIMPVTMLIWVNVHGGFLTGIGLLFTYCIGEFLNRKSYAKYFITLIPTILVTLVNPYGIRFWHYMLEASLMNRPHIFEWHPISMLGPFYNITGMHIHIFFGFFLYLILTLVVVVYLIRKRIQPDWVKVLVIALCLYSAIAHQRHVVFFVFAASALLYNEYAHIFRITSNFINSKLDNKAQNNLSKAKNIAFYSFIIYFCLFNLPKFNLSTFTSPAVYPVGSLEFIKQNNISGNLALPYGWGSYALWKLYPQCLVSIDGRYEEVYSDKVFEIAGNFSDHGIEHWEPYLEKLPSHKTDKNWQKFLSLYHTDIIVAPKYAYTLDEIRTLKGWQIAYEDYVSYVLLPNNKANKLFVSPNYRDKIYWHEDLRRAISLN